MRFLRNMSRRGNAIDGGEEGEEMAVRSSETTRARSTHVVPRHTVEGGAVVLLWILAVALWLVSTFGNFVQFVGGWGYAWPMNAYTTRGILYALIYQALCTVAQWGFKAKRWWGLYTGALLISAIPSFMTYNSWANGWVAGLLGSSAPAEVTWFLASVFLFLVAIFIDLIPEWVLVE